MVVAIVHHVKVRVYDESKSVDGKYYSHLSCDGVTGIVFIKVFISEVLIVVCHVTLIVSSKRVLSVETKRLDFP